MAKRIIVEVEFKGGSGSGNWGHTGRPGLVGGSGGRGGVSIGMASPLTQKERGVIEDYRMGHSSMINPSLYRGTSGKWSGEGGDLLRGEVAALDSAIEKGEFASDGVVYRGVWFLQQNVRERSGFVWKKTPDPFEGMEGKVVESAAFTSTTTSSDAAQNFSQPGEYTYVGMMSERPPMSSYIVKISVPKGTHAVDMSASESGGVAGAFLAGEREILFGRNTRLLINSIVPGEGQTKIVNATIVP